MSGSGTIAILGIRIGSGSICINIAVDRQASDAIYRHQACGGRAMIF